jgi:hypothetical protein
MTHNGHRSGRAAADTTGWLLGTIIVVLAVLDLLMWATLWNVPNPVSKWLTPQAALHRSSPPAAASRSLVPVQFSGKDGQALPAMLTGAPRKLPRSRAQ